MIRAGATWAEGPDVPRLFGGWGGLQLGSPGRWKKFANSLGLTSDLHARMDEIFRQNKGSLLSRYLTLREAESEMEKLTRASHLDEAALFAQIDDVAPPRAELERRMRTILPQLRGVDA